MKSFRIVSTAWGIAILSTLLIDFASVLIFINFFGKGSNIGLIVFFVIIGLGFYCQKFISQAIIEVELTKETISLKYLKQYIFHKDPDRIISFDHVKSYKYQEDRNFNLFRITLIDDTEIDFWHFTLTKDDFDSLVSNFSGIAEHYNKRSRISRSTAVSIDHPQKIERAKTIYEKSTSPVILVLAFIFIIAIPLLMIFKKGEITNPFMGLSAIFGALFYIAAYFKYRKKKKT